MGTSLKKNLRVFWVGPRGSLNAFFFLSIRVIFYFTKTCHGKEGGTSTLAKHCATENCMLRSGRMIRSRKGIY
ncbi:hypothetical protein ES319_D11G265400v1 [Gossypium barbadense]|uniref:Uncharacterized protein n=1 Tax=Gossypium barbadense TaxID=3634 RepID=A0A5J5PG41_GOSBA|nr:hypothetical protein ES319_D11G265400v1 [Gossypium barbadense]